MTTNTVPVSVYVWSLRASAQTLQSFQDSLSESEIERARRFQSDDAARDYIIAHGTMRAILGKLTRCSPGNISFASGVSGKQYLVKAMHSPFFNLSHSGRFAALAVCHLLEVGIDIEVIDETKIDLGNDFLSTDEKASLELVLPQFKAHAIFQSWVLKEAFGKALGVGLSIGIDVLQVAMMPNGDAVPVGVTDPTYDFRDWLFETFEPAPDVVGAIAVKSKTQSIAMSFHRIDPEKIEFC
jgi:4'-phosphopantetheinyl transferase